MARWGKYLSLCLGVLIVVSGLLMIEPSDAHATYKPSVPEFTLEYVDYSYHISPTYTADEFTGETVAIGGRDVKNFTIQINVKNNQLFPPANDATSHLFYNVRFKGHFGNDWRETPSAENRTSSPTTYSEYVDASPHNPYLHEQSNSEYTAILFPANDYNPNVSIDFQVEAVLGHDSLAWVDTDPFGEYHARYYEAVAFDATSGWSTTQTITIPGNTPVPSPIFQQFPIIAILSLLAVVLLIVAIIVSKRSNLKARLKPTHASP